MGNGNIPSERAGFWWYRVVPESHCIVGKLWNLACCTEAKNCFKQADSMLMYYKYDSYGENTVIWRDFSLNL